MMPTVLNEDRTFAVDVLVSVTVVAGLLVLLCVIVCCRKVRKCRRKRRTDRSRGNAFRPRGDAPSSGADFSISPKVFWEELKLDELALEGPMKEKVRLILIQRNKLTLHSLLGEGQYAQVHFGTLLSRQFGSEEKVAVKIMKETWTGQAQSLIEEGMLTIDFNHPNVLTIIGISLEFIHVKQIRPLVVMPFLENGDLHSFLKHTRQNRGHQLSLSMCMDLMVQIASGMEYISSKSIVHRDLATRNCMLDDNFTVKVADFGMARRMQNADFYKMACGREASPLQRSNCLVPVRWVAIEGLTDSTFTTKSDVWSFGVTMWEIMTHAKIPYPGLENYMILEHLESGHRLYRPTGCPVALYNLMLSCWDALPNQRPSFAELRESLQGLGLVDGTRDSDTAPMLHLHESTAGESHQYSPIDQMPMRAL